MLYNISQKNKTADRLKTLRKSKKLSHEKLKNELNKLYFKRKDDGRILKRSESQKIEDSSEVEDIISVPTLKNYELQTFRGAEGKRYNSGYKMNISYMVMFADFYNVSVEYLLGLDDYPSPKIESKVIHEITGLSDLAIKKLESKYKYFNDTLNQLLEDENFFDLIRDIHLFQIDLLDKLIYINKNEIDIQNYFNIQTAEEPKGFVTLNLIEYCKFKEYELKDNFSTILRKLIDSSFDGKSIEYLEREKENKLITFAESFKITDQ